MEWKQEFSVHVPAIDEDHRALADSVTAIERAVARSETRSAAHSAIEQFVALARGHFNRELALMRIHDYPDIEAHIKSHKSFLLDLRALEKKSRTDTLSNATVAFLPTWLEEHLLSYDRDYYGSYGAAKEPARALKTS